MLIKKVYEVDPLICPRCKSGMKIISFITDEEIVYRILEHMELIEPDPPPLKGEHFEEAHAELISGRLFDDIGLAI